MPFGLYTDLYLQFALACHLFDMLVEAFVAQRLILVECEANVADGMVVELGAEM